MLKQAAGQDSKDYVEITPSCCTGNHILNDYFVTHSKLHPVTPVFWEPAWIFDLADRFSDGMPLHSRTCATHSCFLSCEGKLLFECEDIGRHNALDKAIGYALREGIDLGKCIVYSSGRIPTDMVMKAIQAGIPVLASKAAVSAEAVELAREYGVTLVGAARRDRMKVY
jgi:FdhD protein